MAIRQAKAGGRWMYGCKKKNAADPDDGKDGKESAIQQKNRNQR